MSRTNSDLQRNLIKMMSWLDGFCRDNHLDYYALGGTMLGAARHEGFIPWDDDIDIGMPRKDYQRLEELLINNKGRYQLETCNTQNEDYCYPYAKLYDTETTLIENYKPPLVRGTFIDIFPLDGLGSNLDKGVCWFKKVSMGYKFFLTRVAAIRKNRAIHKNAAIIVSRAIPHFILSNRSIRRCLDYAASKYDYDSSTYIGNFFGNWGEREIVPKSVIGKPKEYKFEDITILGVEDYNSYLSCLYGDWRKLPPKDKQITHHDYLFLDLDVSYFDHIVD